jgi:hypothetical protein
MRARPAANALREPAVLLTSMIADLLAAGEPT